LKVLESVIFIDLSNIEVRCRVQVHFWKRTCLLLARTSLHRVKVVVIIDYKVIILGDKVFESIMLC